MRSIKFRSWNGKDFSYFSNGKNDELFEWDEVQHFTGLTDKNGVGIYEGDIISLANNGEIYGVVIFDDGVEFGLPCFCIKSSEGHCENFFDSGDEPRVWFEIIGNIYQNAELLE